MSSLLHEGADEIVADLHHQQGAVRHLWAFHAEHFHPQGGLKITEFHFAHSQTVRGPAFRLNFRAFFRRNPS